MHFVGKDATAVFHAYGHENVLKHRKPVATYEMPRRDPCDDDFEKLRDYFQRRGFFETDYVWYMKKFLVPLSLWLTSWLFVTSFDAV